MHLSSVNSQVKIPAEYNNFDPKVNLKESCIPHITTDQFVVDSIDRGNYGKTCASNCVYPNYKFNYEIPQNVCLPPGESYPASKTYFPGRNTYDTRFDADSGTLYKPGSNLTWCPKKFWNAGPKSVPNLPLAPPTEIKQLPRPPGPPGPPGPPEITQAPPSVQLAPPSVQLEAKKYHISEAGLAAQTINPGEQDNLARRNVRNNRYIANQPADNVYIKPKVTGSEPYNNSLYLTPYDSAKNVISTGKLVNSYTGELYETFENQLPPPNTTKGHIPEYQLKQVSPQLLWANGGYNHRKPPPRKKEQPGYVFNPVSARGGGTAFGSQQYSGEIRKQQELIGIRDIYNNRDGDLPVEPSLIGERPKGMFGLVPRFRTMPYLSPTNELDRCGYNYIPENQPEDLTKRETWTGQHFNRKDPVLVENRKQYANTMVNGVEAVTIIPVMTDTSGPMKSDMEQIYVGAPYHEVGNTMISSTENRETSQILPNLPVQSVDVDHNISGVLPITQLNKVSQKTTIPTENRTGSDLNLVEAGTLTTEINLRDTQKEIQKQAVPIVSVSPGIKQGIIVTEQNLRDTLKGAVMDNPFRNSLDKTTEADPLLTAEIIELRDSLKQAIADNSFPVSATEGVNSVGNLRLDKELRPTWKGKFPHQNYTLGPEGTEAFSVGPGDVSSTQNRGKCEQHYVPSVSQIPEKANGTSTRIIQPIQRQVKWSKESDLIRPVNADDIFQQYASLPAFRETNRSQQAFCDLEQEINDL